MDLSAAYDNRSAVPESARLFESWGERSARRRAAASSILDVRYGPAPRATLDLFPSQRRDAPTLAFFHGGYWQWNRKEDFAFIADGLLGLPLNVAVIGYSLAPQATLDEIVAEARAAVAALARTQRDLFVGGWSAGGHLAAMVAQTGLVRGGFALSGLFDLEPLLRTVLNEQIRLDEDSARRNSPLHGPAIPVPFEIAVGADELPELRRQSQAFAAARAARPEPGTLVVHPGLNHYTILDALGDPESAVVARTARLIGAPPAFVADGTPSERD